MNANGQSFLRKAMRLFSAGVPMQLASDELFAIRPGASIPAMVAYGPMGGPSREEDRKPYRMLDSGIAEIAVVGVLSKHPSLFRLFGCSEQPTLGELTEAVHCAAMDEAVAGIMLYIDSPGGTYAGTPELAAAVADARQKKPVHAYAQDSCCSGGYWPASQADRLTANRAADLGGIGVFSVLLDASKAAGMMGLKFHVVSSGPFKGAGAEPGAGLSAEHLAYFEGRITDSAALFIADFAAGRGLDIETAQELADGRCHIASRAVELKLCDGVGTYAEAVAALAEAIATPAQPRPVHPPAPAEPEPEDDVPPESPEEEAMSKEVKPDAAAAAATGGEGDIGLLEKIKALFTSPAPAAAKDGAAAALPASPLTAEDLDRRIKAEVDSRVQAQEVDRDLRALEGKVPPAVLNKAENREMLLEAKAKSPERYRAALELLAGNDASALLGGPIASAEQTGEAPAGLGISAKERAALNALGMTDAEIAAINTKFDLRVN